MLAASSGAPVAVLQGFEQMAIPITPAISAADTYGSGYLDSLMSHQVNACRCRLDE
jgi:hypothetical protein